MDLNDPYRGANVANFIYPSEVTVSSERVENVGALAQSANWTLTSHEPGFRTWTDDYSNIAGAYLRKMTQRTSRRLNKSPFTSAFLVGDAGCDITPLTRRGYWPCA